MEKSVRYLFIDHGGVLDGATVPSSTEIGANDLLLNMISPTLNCVLRNGVLIFKNLNTLIKEHNYRLCFHSKTNERKQMQLLNLLKNACKTKSVEFPPITVTAVRDDREFKNVQSTDPKIKKSWEFDIQIAGYDIEVPGKACVRNALSALLKIPQNERKNHFVIDDGEDIIITAQEEGWSTYLICDSKTGATLHNVIVDILNNARGGSPSKISNEETKTSGYYGPKPVIEKVDYHRWQDPIDCDEKAKLFKPIDKARSQIQVPGWFSIGIFKNMDTLTEWIGKCNVIDDIELSKAEACKQKIAADIYGCYGATFGRPVEISVQKLINTGIPQQERNEQCHIMSEVVDGVKSYRTGCGKNLKKSMEKIGGEIILDNGDRIKEKGLGKILALGLFINDSNVIGADWRNIGFRIEREGNGSQYARSYKINNFDAFKMDDDELEGQSIKIAMAGMKEVLFKNLHPETKREFLITLIQIKEAEKEDIKEFFQREGAEIYTAIEDVADSLPNWLMERREKILELYQSEINQLLN